MERILAYAELGGFQAGRIAQAILLSETIQIRPQQTREITTATKRAASAQILLNLI